MVTKWQSLKANLGSVGTRVITLNHIPHSLPSPNNSADLFILRISFKAYNVPPQIMNSNELLSYETLFNNVLYRKANEDSEEPTGID